VAEKRLAAEGSTACREGEKDTAGGKAELLLERKLLGMREGAVEAC